MESQLQDRHESDSKEATLDSGVLTRACAGDRDAFAEVYDRFAPMVHAVLLTSGSRDDVEDLMQEVFFSAWKSLGSLRGGEHLGGWLATIARNRARRGFSRQRSKVTLPDEIESKEPPVSAAMDGALVLAEIRTLPETYRETLSMRLVEGMTGPEIAAATGMTRGSVRVHLHRGMTLLRERLTERGYR